MSNLPKYLGIEIWDGDNLTDLLRDLTELVTGEAPNGFKDIVDGKTVTYFLCSIENTKNEELIEYLEDIKVEAFTCRFDIDSNNYEFVSKEPFIYHKAEEVKEPKIEVDRQTDNFVLDILKLELETDIFKFVDNAENNDYYDIFSQEQTAISLTYARLGKDILTYQADNLINLVSRVEQELVKDPNYQKLQEQEQGLAILKDNNQMALDDLEQRYSAELTELSSRLTQAIIDDNKKETSILQIQVKETNAHLEEERESLLGRQQKIVEGNLLEISNTRTELRYKIIDLADSLTDYNFKELYNYEQRYIQARDMVVNDFNVNKEKERQRLENAEKEKVRLLEEEEEQRLEEEARKEAERLIQEEEYKQREKQEELDRQLQAIDTEEKQSNPSVSSNVEVSAPTQDAIPLNEKLLQMTTSNTQPVVEVVPPVQPQIQELPEQEEAELVETKSDSLLDEITKNDTIQWSNKGSDETAYYENLEKAKNDDRLEAEPKAKNEKPDKTDNKVMAYIKSHKVITVSAVAGLLLLGYLSIRLASATNQSTIEQSQTTEAIDTTQSSANDKKELSETLYKENVKIMAESGLGMYLDDDGNLTGTMKVKDSEGNIQLRYIQEYTKYGELKVTDSDGKQSLYDKEWVDSFITQLASKK